ncbi:MAG TPA: hypothetical protein VE344_02580 [Methylomirabilota bacterium]|nr:hypothetical protein [Methylomirabilota bacterium]
MTKLKHFGNVGIIYAVSSLRKENAMMKTLEVMSETIRNPKHPFRKTEHLPKKPQKNRYERRKIKEFLHLGDWLSEEMA